MQVEDSIHIPAPPTLPAWQAEIAEALPNLSKPQVKVLALYSLGMVQAGSAGLSSVAYVAAQWLNQSFATVRERLRDWYRNADMKSGQQRRELSVPPCFPGLLAWLLRLWPKDAPLALALDATTLGQRFVVLSISVLFCSVAIPVAWRILPAGKKQAWKPLWLELLSHLQQTVPPEKRVIVLADRGLYARWLYRGIVALGWHPFLRINEPNASFRPEGQRYRSLGGLLPPEGQYAQQGRIFRCAQTSQDCTLLGARLPGYADTWWVVSDLAPESAQTFWYGLRSWIERGFKFFKSGGWKWQDTRMEEPAHAERLWLAMTLASLYLLRSQPQQQVPTGPVPLTTAAPKAVARAQAAVSPPSPASRPGKAAQQTPKPQRRILSLFRSGLLLAQMLLGLQNQLPPVHFHTQPWPTTPEPSLILPPHNRSP